MKMLFAMRFSRSGMVLLGFWALLCIAVSSSQAAIPCPGIQIEALYSMSSGSKTKYGDDSWIITMPRKIYRRRVDTVDHHQVYNDGSDVHDHKFTSTNEWVWTGTGLTLKSTKDGECDLYNAPPPFQSSKDIQLHAQLGVTTACTNVLVQGVNQTPEANRCSTSFYDSLTQPFQGIFDEAEPTWHITADTTTIDTHTEILTCNYPVVPPQTITGSQTTIQKLSNEYTTGELVAELREALAGFGGGGTGSSSGFAQLHLDPTERCGTATAMVYQFQFWGEARVTYRITWQEVSRSDDGTVAIRMLEEELNGLGSAKSIGIVHKTRPPEHPGTITVENVALEMESEGSEDGTGYQVGLDRMGNPQSGPGYMAAPGRGSLAGSDTSTLFSGSSAFRSSAQWMQMMRSQVGLCQSCSGTGAEGGYPRTAGEALFENAGVSFSISLGRNQYGRSAGRLAYASPSPVPLSSTEVTLTNLYVNTGGSDTLVVLNQAVIHQVQAEQTTVNVVTNAFGEYQFRFYYTAQAQGPRGEVQAFSGEPFVKWTLKLASGEVQVVEEKAGQQARTFIYSQAPSISTLTYPGGDVVDTHTATSIGDIVQVSRSVTGSGTSGLQITEKYKKYPWGQGLIEQFVQYGAYSKTTRREYYDTGIANGTMAPLKTVIYPTGYWEKYSYDPSNGRVTQVVQQFGDNSTNSVASDNRVLDYDYTPNETQDNGGTDANSPRRIIETLKGTEVGRRYYMMAVGLRIEKVCVTPGAAYTAADNLVTLTLQDGAIMQINRPDGTIQRSIVTADDHVNRTVIARFGAPNETGTDAAHGVEWETLEGSQGQLTRLRSYDLANSTRGALLSEVSYLNLNSAGQYDLLHRSRRALYLDGSSNWMEYACCGLTTFKDRDGTITTYGYDPSRLRRISLIRNGITYLNEITGTHIRSRTYGTDGSSIINLDRAYDPSGTVGVELDALNRETSKVEFIDSITKHLVRLTTLPNQAAQLTEQYQDGTLQSVTGTAVTRPIKYQYGVSVPSGLSGNSYFSKTIALDSSGAETAEWVRAYQDMAGRVFQIESPKPGGGLAIQKLFYNVKGQLARTIDADGVSRLYEYNSKGELEYVTQDLNQNGTRHEGTDRVRHIEHDVVSSHGTTVQRTRVSDYKEGGVWHLGYMREEAVDGPAGSRVWETINGVTVLAYEESFNAATGLRQVIRRNLDGSASTSTYTYGRLTQVQETAANGDVIRRTTFDYDVFGRLQNEIDQRNGATTYGYNAAYEVMSVQSPAHETGAARQTTTFVYNALSQVNNVVYPDQNNCTYEYFPNGLFKKQFGSRVTPVEYSYDHQGRIKTLKTWRNYAGDSGAAITTFNYLAETGLLQNRQYDGTAGPAYTYKDSGRLQTRAWQRGVTTTYSYNNAGEPAGIDYSDSTPDVTYQYDLRGNLTSVVQGGITTTLSRNANGQLIEENHPAGVLAGQHVQYDYDSLLRRFSLGLSIGGIQMDFAYDTASRLTNITRGTTTIGSSFYPYSSLPQDTAFTQGSVVRTTTRTWDNLNRLKQIAGPGSGGALSFDYGYNTANQRTSVQREDGSRWSYGYDALGQLGSAKHFWDWNNTPIPGQQFEYTFDDIGNRLTSKAGGNETGTSLRSANYSPTSTNTYAQREVPGAMDIIGSGTTRETITVNGQSTYRHGQYFRAELTVNNSGGPVFTDVSILGTGSPQATAAGKVFLPRTPEVFTYDKDGNLTGDGRWIYTWDGENRLVKMESISTVPDDRKRTLEFAYDGFGRRIQKVVKNFSGTVLKERRFVFDGWNLLAEMDGSSALVTSYTWGNDLSGMPNGLGGVGGLMMVTSHNTPSPTNYFAIHDGSGNNAGLIEANSGKVAARFEFGPFGEMIRISGPAAGVCSLLYSDQYWDADAGLYWYPARPYNPQTGRWLSRDPSGEIGGPNLFNFVANNPVSYVDPDGRFLQVVGPAVSASLPATSSLILSIAPTLGAAYAIGWAAQKIIDWSVGNADGSPLPLPSTHRGVALNDGEWRDQVGNVRDREGRLLRDKLGRGVGEAEDCTLASKNKGINVGPSGHHVPAVRKSLGRPFEVGRTDKSRPTLFSRGNDPAHDHWRLHDAERKHIGPRQGNFPGSDEQLFDAYRKAYRGLDDIRVDVRSPDGSFTLGEDVSPSDGVDLIERWLRSKGLR